MEVKTNMFADDIVISRVSWDGETGNARKGKVWAGDG